MPTWLLLLLFACNGDDPATTITDIDPEPAATDVAPEPEPLPEPTEEKYAASQVLIAWQGAVRAPETVTRSAEEAHELAETLRARALAGETIEVLARSHSDGPSAPRGGDLGVYLTGTMVPDFEKAVASVEVGEIGPLVETPFGWHVVRRDAVIEARAAHILVSWDGAWRADTTRTREEALTRIGEAKTRLDAGEEFASIATELSDDPTASVGGELGSIAPGQMIPAFEDALFALEEGARSDVVETPYGFHVIWRH